MSNTITIKDPNGNIVCSVENMDASRSEEGVLKEIVKDPGLLMSTVFLTAIGAFVGISSIKNKDLIHLYYTLYTMSPDGSGLQIVKDANGNNISDKEVEN